MTHTADNDVVSEALDAEAVAAAHAAYHRALGYPLGIPPMENAIRTYLASARTSTAPVAVTDSMLNAGQERLCQLASATHFDDYIQAEIFKAMLAAAPPAETTRAEVLETAAKVVEGLTHSYDDHGYEHKVGYHDALRHAASELRNATHPLLHSLSSTTRDTAAAGQR